MDGNVSYTFNYGNLAYKENSKAKMPSNFYFENLLIKENNKQGPFYYIIGYHPEKKWWQHSKNFSDYSGKITFYTLEGTSLGTVGFINGKPIEQENKSCTLSIYEGDVICTSLNHPDGSNYGWDCEQTYEYSFNCSGGGTGEYPGHDNDGPGGDPNGGGNSDGSGGSGGSDNPGGLPDTGGGFVPDIPEDEEEKEGEITFKIDDEELDNCLKNILNDLLGHNHGIGNMLTIFESNVSGYNWTVESSNLNGEVAQTEPPSSYDGSITTVFDSEEWDQATDLSWARTILHEAAHAYLSTFYATERPNWIATYPDMVEDWGELQNWNDVHHEEFARSLVDDIALILQEYGEYRGYDLDSQFYFDLAWGGLQETSAFDSLSESEKERILNKIAIELTGKNLNNDSSTQKGLNCN